MGVGVDKSALIKRERCHNGRFIVGVNDEEKEADEDKDEERDGV